MKSRHFVIVGVFLLVLVLIYYPILKSESTEEEQEKEEAVSYVAIKEVKNRAHSQKLASYGQILPNQQIDIVMEVQGEIDRENPPLKAGQFFSKNQVLIKVERTEALYNLLSRRSSFINLISGFLPDISLDHKSEQNKWRDYLNQLDPTNELPPLPQVSSQQEKLLINAKNIPTEYYAIKGLERQTEKYYYIAPFDGVIVESFVEPGSMVTPGARLATIAKTNNYEVKAPINLNLIEAFEKSDTIFFTSPQKEKIGYGKLTRLSKVINMQTQSVDGYFNIQPVEGKRVFQGMFVNLNLEVPVFDTTVVLPDNAVVNNQVQLLKDSTIHVKNIEVIGSKRDSLFVKGINDGDKVVLKQLSSPSEESRFIGIER